MQDIQEEKANHWKLGLFGLAAGLVFISLQFVLELKLKGMTPYGHDANALIAIVLALVAVVIGQVSFRKFLPRPDWSYVVLYFLLTFSFLLAIAMFFADGYLAAISMALNFSAIFAIMGIFSGQKNPWKKATDA